MKYNNVRVVIVRLIWRLVFKVNVWCFKLITEKFIMQKRTHIWINCHSYIGITQHYKLSLYRKKFNHRCICNKFNHINFANQNGRFLKEGHKSKNLQWWLVQTIKEDREHYREKNCGLEISRDVPVVCCLVGNSGKFEIFSKSLPKCSTL